MSELIKRSIKALSAIMNTATGLSHPLDESRATDLLKALHAVGETLDVTVVKNSAVENGWPVHHAENLAKLAQKVSIGHRAPFKTPRDWGERTVLQLKEEIKA